MASFDRRDAEVTAVFIRRMTGPNSSVLRRANYDLITYPDGSSGLEPVPVVNESNANVTTSMSDFEVDRIEVYDADPFEGIANF